MKEFEQPGALPVAPEVAPETVAREPAQVRATRDSIADIWGPRTPYHGAHAWPSRVDERTIETPERWVPSACVLCSNGCALEIGVKQGRIVGVRGRAHDVVNHGRLGPKGLHAFEANASPDRLTQPLLRRNGRLEPVSWDEAWTAIVTRMRRTLEKFGPSAIGFYTSGQLFLEEYYTLAVIARGGLGTPHLDGNTRLCTATAAQALIESFGCDGDPGSYADFDVTDAFFIVGHNPASQQTVLWSRVLDRRAGPNPPRIVVVDPRRSETAREADVHLAPRPGTNLALLNGLLHLVIASGNVDTDFVRDHTIGYDELAATVARFTPERTAILTGVPVDRLRAAADLLGTTRSLVSTVLQGVYQSHQATASAVQVNNLHLIRGLIGKPGSGVLQMNGQPTAENTRETGCDGSMPGFRNWDNPEHIRDLARIWNVEPAVIPHWAPPTHALQIFRYAEEGSIKVLWISATNPAVSMPELDRFRNILGRREPFVIVQDAFLNETGELADLVLPAAIWGEKTGTFTNADRTVHLSRKAIDPPGEAKSDLDIFLELARRLELQDKDGQPLVKWKDAAGAFEAWKACSKGRPCDYSGMSYEMLERGGVRWPCNAVNPKGTERLYSDHHFPTEIDSCETYGHDLVTGAPLPREKYADQRPDGRAILKACDAVMIEEQPDEEYPFWLTTGRLVYHFHTRTKTGRSPALEAAAPDVFVQMAVEDARRLGISENDPVEIASRRGKITARARLGDIEPGVVFVPFHYGERGAGGRKRAANELTLTGWDPVSKQPFFKFAAVQLARRSSLDGAPSAIATATGKLVGAVGTLATDVATLLKAPAARPHVAEYVGLVRKAERNLASALREVGERHAKSADVLFTTKKLATWCDEHVRALEPIVERYGERRVAGPDERRESAFQGTRSGGVGLVLDLHELWLLAQEAVIGWTVLAQVAQGLRDDVLQGIVHEKGQESERTVSWLRSRIRVAAPQALVVPS